MLGTPALFATAYGNVGSSIYYALGAHRRFYALGLTPLVFVVAGLIFACTAATYAEGTARFPEAGGSASFARHAFDELVSFGAGWAQMLVTSSRSPSRRSSCRTTSRSSGSRCGRTRGTSSAAAIVIVVLVALNVVGVQEAARLNITLAVVDFATQVLLVIDRLRARPQPRDRSSTTCTGAWRRPGRTSRSRSRSRCSPTRGSRRSRTSPRRRATRCAPFRARTSSSAVAVFAIYFTLPLVALSALPGGADRRRARRRGSRSRRRRAGTRTTRSSVSSRTSASRRGWLLDALEIYVGILAATILFIATNAGVIGASRITYSMAGYRQLPGGIPARSTRAARRRGSRSSSSPGSSRSSLLLPGDVNFIGTLYSLGATLSFTVAHASVIRLRQRDRTGRGRVPRAAQSPHRRRRLAAVRLRRRASRPGLVPRARRPEPGDALGRAWLAGVRPRRLRRLPAPFVRARAAARDREGAARLRPGARARVPPHPRAGRAGQALGRGARRRLSARGGARRAHRRRVGDRDAARPAARGRRPELEALANRELDEAVAIGDSYGVPVVGRLERARAAGPAIVAEAEARQAEIIVLGAPRGELTARQRAVFGKTVDYVLKHAPCRTLVVASGAAA